LDDAPRPQLWISAEHALHALLAADGRRVAFPKRHHGNLFFAEIPTSVELCCEIARAVARRAGREAVFAAAGAPAPGAVGDVTQGAVAVAVAKE